MKINLELLIALIIGIIIISSSLYFESPNVDDYWHFSISKLILRDPSVLIRTTYDAAERRFITGATIPKNILSYPMLMHIMLVPFVAIGAEKIFFVILFIVLMILMWKWEKRAIPFLFISFVFLRTSIYGGIDMPMAVLSVGCIYFFEKKPIVSGVFAGLSPLIKGIGFMVFLSYILAILIFKRKMLSKRIIMGIVIAILLTSTWYLRNLIYQDWNILEAITGNIISQTELFQRTGFQAISSPERYLWDNSGYYPLPIDILLYVGLAFTIYNFYKTRKFVPEHIFIIIAIIAYFGVHIIDIAFMSGLRLYIFIFPFLAVQIARSLSDKWLKYGYAISLIIFVFLMLNIPKYAWNAMDSQIKSSQLCQSVKNTIGNDYVYVDAFQDLYIIWKCGLTYQTTLMNDSVWTLDMYNGTLDRTVMK